jgi:hypothetical protein
MPTFTAWSANGQPRYFVSPSERPYFSDGSPMPDSDEQIWAVEASSWEVRKSYALQGWGRWHEGVPQASREEGVTCRPLAMVRRGNLRQEPDVLR